MSESKRWNRDTIRTDTVFFDPFARTKLIQKSNNRNDGRIRLTAFAIRESISYEGSIRGRIWSKIIMVVGVDGFCELIGF